MATQIKTLIDNQNNIDEIDREINNLEPIMNYSTTNNVTKPNLIDNVSNALFGEVEAEAWWWSRSYCSRWASTRAYWWGVRHTMNNCASDWVSYNWGNFISTFGMLTSTVCAFSAVFAPWVSLYSCAGIGVILWQYGRISGSLDYHSRYCKYVNFDFNWWLTWSVKC